MCLIILCYRIRVTLKAAGPGEIDGDARSPKDALKNGIQSVTNIGGIALGVTSAALLASIPTVANAKDEKKKTWVKVELPMRETLFDISFDPTKPEHGWLVGAKGTFLETFDNGDTWAPRSFSNLDEDEEINYRFEVASISENEGWIIGKPAIMLHTRDGGKQFERIPVSPKLPGEPTSIKATGLGKAEMITSQGAVYTTVNGGLNWKAQVKETIDATLNRVSSSGTSGASFFTGKIANQVRLLCPHCSEAVSMPFSYYHFYYTLSIPIISHLLNHIFVSLYRSVMMLVTTLLSALVVTCS